MADLFRLERSTSKLLRRESQPPQFQLIKTDLNIQIRRLASRQIEFKSIGKATRNENFGLQELLANSQNMGKHRCANTAVQTKPQQTSTDASRPTTPDTKTSFESTTSFSKHRSPPTCPVRHKPDIQLNSRVTLCSRVREVVQNSSSKSKKEGKETVRLYYRDNNLSRPELPPLIRAGFGKKISMVAAESKVRVEHPMKITDQDLGDHVEAWVRGRGWTIPRLSVLNASDAQRHADFLLGREAVQSEDENCQTDQ